MLASSDGLDTVVYTPLVRRAVIDLRISAATAGKTYARSSASRIPSITRSRAAGVNAAAALTSCARATAGAAQSAITNDARTAGRFIVVMMEIGGAVIVTVALV